MNEAALVARTTIAHHSKSFAMASKLLGRRISDQTAVVYTWCRRADDAVDEHGTADLSATLARLSSELDDAYAGRAVDPVLAAFGDLARARQIPRAYPEQLLAGMAMDASGHLYLTLDHVLLYGWRVAGVVGLMMSHVFGVADEAALTHAAHLGIAMQLTNICRDVAEDWERGRLYLPDELLASHGAQGLAAELRGPLPASAQQPIARTVADLLALADRYYASGDRGLRALPWRASLAVSAARRIYAGIGSRIADTGHDITAGRAHVSRGAKLGHVAAALGQLALDTPRRIVQRFSRPRPLVPTRVLERSDVAHA